MVLGSGIRDPRSRIRDPEKTYSGSRIPDPGVKKHPIPDPGSGSATLQKSFSCPWNGSGEDVWLLAVSIDDNYDCGYKETIIIPNIGRY